MPCWSLDRLRSCGLELAVKYLNGLAGIPLQGASSRLERPSHRLHTKAILTQRQAAPRGPWTINGLNKNPISLPVRTRAHAHARQ